MTKNLILGFLVPAHTQNQGEERRTRVQQRMRRKTQLVLEKKLKNRRSLQWWLEFKIILIA
jgi:hypothetical protein